jgi:hypothetical protein
VSIEVAADELAKTVEGFAFAYLLTLGDRPRPHIGAVNATVVDGVVRVQPVGRTAMRDVAGHDAVTLLWPPGDPGGYSLIVDGTAQLVDDRIDVTPQRAVLHRPAPAAPGADSSCSSDCLQVPTAG